MRNIWYAVPVIDETKRFLETVKRLTEIQAVPNVFKSPSLEEEGRVLNFLAARGQYLMTVTPAEGNEVDVRMLQDGRRFRLWVIRENGKWQELETGETGEDFTKDRQRLAQRLLETIGSRPEH